MDSQKKRVSDVFLQAGLVPYLALVVAPFSLYLGNRSEFDLTPLEMLIPLVGVALTAALGVAIILALVWRWSFLQNLFVGGITGVAVAVWAQSQLLRWNFGPLDGRDVDWSRWATHGSVELFLWGALVATGLYMAFRNRNSILDATRFIYILGIASLLSAYLSVDDAVGVEDNLAGTPKLAVNFHPENNALLIVLDTFQSDVLEEILKDFPDEVDFLEGFTFYPDSVGGFPTTRASIPLIISGRLYDNLMPFNAWLQAEVVPSNLFTFFEDKGFGVGLVGNAVGRGIGRYRMTSMADLDHYEWGRLIDLSLPAINAGILLSVPTTLKPYVYSGEAWATLRSLGDDQVPLAHHGTDWRFMKYVQRNIEINSDKRGEFKYWHFRGAHWPLVVNESYQRTEKMPSNRASYLRQSRGVLKLLKDVFWELKEIGVYEAAEIMVLGDHGSLPILPEDFYSAKGVTAADFPRGSLASARPAFMYKAPMAMGPLTTNSSSIHLKDAVCILSDYHTDFDCPKFNVLEESGPRSRRFMFYRWKHEYWSRDYMPRMYEYRIKGDVRNLDSWENTGLEYADGNVFHGGIDVVEGGL